jgi:hypothetical protein
MMGGVCFGACGGSGGGGTAGNGGASGAAGTTGTAGTTGAAGTTGGGGSGGSVACGTNPGPGSGDGCNTTTLAGPCVTTQLSSATAPTPAGGTIVAGTYNLTSSTFYGSADAGNQQQDVRKTLMVSLVTAVAFTLDQVDQSGDRTDRAHGTVVISGTTVTFTPTCPPPGDGGDKGGSASFTATSTTFTLIQAKNGSTQVEVYTKS